MFRNYLLTAWLVYTRRKLFTAINLLCITLTLGVLLVVTALLQNAFFPSGVEGKSERFLQVGSMVSTHTDGHMMRTGPLGYRVIDRQLKPLQGKQAELVSAVSGPRTTSVYRADRVVEVMMRRADAEYWQILDFTVLDGRVPSVEDVARGRFVAVLNRSTAKKLFGNARAVGQPIDVGGQGFQVIGVVEDAMHVNAFADLWVPVSTDPSSDYRTQMWGDYTALILARSPADIPAIQAEVARLATTVKYDDPKQFNKALFWADSKLGFFARQLLGTYREPDSGAWVLLAVIGALMLLFMTLPALNLINLNVGRMLERSSEIGVRKAFGATSRQLVWQFVVENVLLCLFGGLLGLALAKAALVWLEGSGLIPYLKVELNLAVFGWGLLLALVFGLLSGVIPAWKMSRLHPVQALKGV
ncbi:MAG: ABC transporter permease, partial [Arenimonas sp.]